MKKFIIKAISFVFLFVFIDFFSGLVFDTLKKNAKGGSTLNNYHIMKECTDDIIILGSSRAIHHYMPTVIEDSTQMSCYNCGEEGNGSILAAARLKMILSRYNPKLVIYEVTPGYDYLMDISYTQYLRYLKPYYAEPNVKNIVDRFVDKNTRLTLRSNLYKENSASIAYLLDNITYRDNLKGFAPLHTTMKQGTTFKLDTTPPVVDLKKSILLEEMVQECRDLDIPFLFVVSPMYIPLESCYYDEARRIATKYGVPFISHIKEKGFCGNYLYFQDNSHMNEKGAHEYSKIFAHELKSFGWVK